MSRTSYAVLAKMHGIELGRDFDALTSDQVNRILAAADSVKYRQPKNANGSRARYFYARLNRDAAASPPLATTLCAPWTFNGTSVLDTKGRNVCTKENGPLIAAAPSQLAALQKAQRALQYIRDGKRDGGTMGRCSSALDEVNAALGGQAVTSEAETLASLRTVFRTSNAELFDSLTDCAEAVRVLSAALKLEPSDNETYKAACRALENAKAATKL